MLDITVLDHLIIGDDSYYSLRMRNDLKCSNLNPSPGSAQEPSRAYLTFTIALMLS